MDLEDAEETVEKASKPLLFRSLKEEIEVLQAKGLHMDLVQKESNLWMVHHPSQSWRMVVRLDGQQVNQCQWLIEPAPSPELNLPCSLSQIIESLDHSLLS